MEKLYQCLVTLKSDIMTKQKRMASSIRRVDFVFSVIRLFLLVLVYLVRNR